MNRIIVVAPHSDDETIGAGGYLLKHKQLGDTICWINVTNAAGEYGYQEEDVKIWNRKIEIIKEQFKFDNVFDLALEPSGLDKIEKSRLINLFKDILHKVKPNIVLIPYYNDAHSDHRIVFESMMACCKSFRCPFVEMILCMEILSETDYSTSDFGFSPNYYVDISEYIDRKIEILKIYDSEISSSPFPRSVDAIKSLAKYRGASCYAHYAEAFRMIKFIER